MLMNDHFMLFGQNKPVLSHLPDFDANLIIFF